MTTSSHSSEFIAEMKTRLETERTQLLQNLGKHARKDHGDFQADPPDYGRSEEENADEVADYIATNATTEAEELRLENIEAALSRIEAGTYGVTDAGDLIPEERLRANPAATTIITQ